MATIRVEKIELDEEFISSKSGILNALTYASAEYIYKVLERHSYKEIIWFDKEKQRKLHRTIIHKNAHLDEYFAELIFRSILPKHLKDIEVYEHILMSKEQDAYARISFPNAVVFGIRTDEAGGAKALKFFDEHSEDGTRTSSSCSQLVAETFLGSKIPYSIGKVLEEINYSDSYSGAHQYHIKNVLFALNNVFFLIGKEDIEGEYVTKLLTENWKRALNNACIISFIFCIENGLLKGFPKNWNNNFKNKIEGVTKKSLDRFLQRTYFKNLNDSAFKNAQGRILNHFRVWSENEATDKNFHNTINGSFWKDKATSKNIESQFLLLQPLCFALQQCWGDKIADFIMFHLWQSLLQLQTTFEQVKQEISGLSNFKTINGLCNLTSTRFGDFCRIDLKLSNFQPQKKKSDDTKRDVENITHFQLYYASISNPSYSNIKQVFTSLLNERNGGFGLIIIEDKSINSKAITRGTSMPYDNWVLLSNKIMSLEPECWFQLQPDGVYADFLLNRTEAHQDQLPSSLIDIDFIVNVIHEI